MDLSRAPAQEDVRLLLERLLAREVPTDVVRRAEPLGFDQATWAHLCQAGVPGMGAPSSLGGGGASLDVLVTAAEAVGRALAPAPVVEHQVATAVWCGLRPDDSRTQAVVQGSRIAAFAPRPASSTACLVPGGAVADVVVSLDEQELVAVWAPPPPPGTAPVNLASAPLADRDLRTGQRVVLATGPEAVERFLQAADHWRVLTAASLVGLARGALELVLAYANERVQFGVPIGAFQAVQHGLADLPGEIDGARLLTAEAAWSIDQGVPSASGATGAQLAAMAFLFAADVARRTTAVCVQYHGGYGYAEEQDPQLYYRRARGWPLVLGDPGAERRRLGSTLAAVETP